MKESGIEKQISKGIQIIAILMMVFHHTFGFPEKYLNGISYIGLNIGNIHVEQFIGTMCKICVSLFAFGTGYALAHKNLTLKYIWKKACSLMAIYWFSLAIFEIVKYSNGEIDSIQEIIKNASMYSFSINNNAWYLSFYILALMTLFFLQKINAKWWISLVFIIVCVPVNFLFEQNSFVLPFSLNNYFIYIPLVIFGYYLNSSLFNKMYSLLYKNSKCLLLSGVLLIVTLGLRVVTGSNLYGFRFVWIYGPIMYLALAAIIKYLTQYKIINSAISIFGEYTAEIWLFHGVFTTPILWIQRVCFMPKISLLIFAWEIILTILIALLYKQVYKYFKKCLTVIGCFVKSICFRKK